MKWRQKENHPNWKGGKYVNSYGYLMIHKDFVDKKYHTMQSSDGYIAEHRLVKAKQLSRPLETKELVHHINNDKLDNREENLKIVTKGQHSGIHYSISLEDKQQGQAVISLEKARKIKELLKKTLTHQEIANKLDVSKNIVSNISCGRNWRNA